MEKPIVDVYAGKLSFQDRGRSGAAPEFAAPCTRCEGPGAAGAKKISSGIEKKGDSIVLNGVDELPSSVRPGEGSDRADSKAPSILASIARKSLFGDH
jgi:hypothetical protein